MRRSGRVQTLLVLAGAGVLLHAGTALAEEGVVAPGDLVIESVYFTYGYQGCNDAFPTVEADAWYEDAQAVRIPGSEFKPIVVYNRTSADVGFYVADDAVDGYVVLDVSVLYDGCPDGGVTKAHYALFRWRVDTSIEREPAPLPLGGVAGTLGFVAVTAGSFSLAQRRSTQRRHREGVGEVGVPEGPHAPPWVLPGAR